MAYFLAKISNLLKWLEKIKLCVNRVSLACIYVGRTNQKLLRGGEFFAKLRGARLENVPAEVSNGLQVNF